MVASFAVIKSTGYYTRKAEAAAYYTAGETTGTWLRGHETLGIAAGEAVRAEDFDRVCAGVDAAGNLLVKNASGPRMLGVDVTLSSPKAISALFAAGDADVRRLIAECEMIAVEATVSLVEHEIPLARRGHGGATREHAKFVAAVFTHSEARPEEHADGSIMPSPQRHHHVCIPSVGQRPDGTWGAIDSIGLRKWKKALGAIYRLQLATALQERGFAIEQTDDDWRWSIAGVPETVCKFFSARRASLEEELAAAGLTSTAAPALAAAINRTERREKMDLSSEDLTQRWHKAMRDLGFAPEDIVTSALDAGRTASLDRQALDGVRTKRLKAVPDHLTEHTATFSRRELIEKTANGLVGTLATMQDALAATDGLVDGEQIVELATTRDGPVYSTPTMVAAERALTELVVRAASTRVAGPEMAMVEQLLDGDHLKDEQKNVVRAATLGARLTLVQGGAGTGKSTTLNAVSKAWQASGYTVVGAAVAWRAANTLTTDLGIEARAIDAWLMSIEHGNEPFNRTTCLIVEEGGLQSTPQALRLLQAVERAGGITIIVGDENQLQPVGPGHAMRLIRETVGAVEIATVVRQREEWARNVPGTFARGEARQALDAFAARNLIHTRDGPRATIEAVADRWQALTEKSQEHSVLVAAKTNAEVRAVSAAIRNRLRDRGVISGADTVIEAADASGNRHTLRLAVGDHIRFLRRNDELGVVNGSQARILDIDTEPDGMIAINAEKDGKQFAFTPADVADAKGRARLSHAYAATIFQSQGMTIDYALILVSSRYDRHDAYVSASRARETTELFVDGTTLDKELEQSGVSVPETDRAEARMAHLATKLARRSLKVNAIDVIAEREQARAKDRELDHEL